MLAALMLIAINLLATCLVVCDSRRHLSEVVAECGLIWLAPLFGALVSLAIGASGPAKVRVADPGGAASAALPIF